MKTFLEIITGNWGFAAAPSRFSSFQCEEGLAFGIQNLYFYEDFFET